MGDIVDHDLIDRLRSGDCCNENNDDAATHIEFLAERIAELERGINAATDAHDIAETQNESLKEEIERLRGLLVRNNICPKCGSYMVVDYRAGKAVNHRCKDCGWAALEGGQNE